MRILLAEDDAIARTAIAAGLSEIGHDVELAADGEEALMSARRTRPDVIISDVLMPRMDGYSLCQAVRSDERLYKVPVVFYSATFLEPQDRALAQSVGASGFILKDNNPAEFQLQLQQVVNESLDREQHAPPPPLDEEELERRHYQALTDKLTKKVDELERERQALRDSEQLLEQILTTIPDVVFVLSLPGLVPAYVAPEAERLLGFSGDEMMGDAVNWQSLLDEDERERIVAEIRQAVASRSSAVTLGRMRHKEGGYRWVEARFSPRLDDNGEPMELVGSLTDVSERIAAQELLRERERSLSTLLRNLPGMAYRCRNTPQWDMAFVSNGAEAVSGYTPKELVGENAIAYGDLILADERRRVWREVQQAIENNRQFSLAYPIRHKDGSIRWVWERGVGVLGEDGAMWVEGFINDITQRKRAEDELVALNRVLQTLSEGNRTLVHAPNEAVLLEHITRVFAEQGDYPVAWVSLPGEDKDALECRYAYGEQKEVLTAWGWQQMSLSGQQPVVRAYLDNLSVIISRSGGTAEAYGLDASMAGLGLETVYLLPIAYREEVFGVVGILSRLPVELRDKELVLLKELASDVGYGVHSHRTELARVDGLERLHSTLLHTVEAVSLALEKRDPYTAGHQERVAQLAVAIAREMGFDEQHIEGIHLGSMVHDIGKISVPAEILNRPGRLSTDEFGVIKAHPETGYEILKGVDFPWPIAEMIIQHHERLDGSGYPRGLKGEEIIPEARILAVADVVEAITSHRPYRPSLGVDIALDELERGRSTLYDAQVVDVCLRLFREQGFDWKEGAAKLAG